MISVLVIGAGPAGLAVAHELRRRGVSARILEAGPGPAFALRHLDPELGLVSPRPLSGLPGWRWPAGPLTFGTLAEGLSGWARVLEICFDFKVIGVDVVEGGYHVRSEGASLEARAVVCCTGVLSQPRLPAGIGASTIPWWHARDVRPEHIQGRRDLLVVGGGVSAGEVLARWLRTAGPDDHARLALRSPLRSLPRRLLGIDTHYLAWLPEHLPARLGPWRLGLRSEPLLDRDAQRALRRGRIEKVAGFAALEGTQVRLLDGSIQEPDAVVFATGYDHQTPVDALLQFDAEGWPILRGCEARPGLYLLGMRFARSLASPFLRGIGRDARFTARKLARFLSH